MFLRKTLFSHSASLHPGVKMRTDRIGLTVLCGGSRPSRNVGGEGGRGGGGAFEGLTVNVEICENNSGRSKKMRYFRKIRRGGGCRAPPLDLDPPLVLLLLGTDIAVCPSFLCFSVFHVDAENNQVKRNYLIYMLSNDIK